MDFINTYEECMKKFAPVITDLYGKGHHMILWDNAGKSDSYLQAFPEEVVQEGERLDEEDGCRYLLVSDSSNMIRKSVMYLTWKKRCAFRAAAAKRDLPLGKREADPNMEPDVLLIDLTTKGEEKTGAFRNETRKFNKWNFMYFTNFPEGRIDEEWLQVILEQRESGTFAGVSRRKFEEPQIQRLIYEGGYKVLFLPEEEDQYYERFAEKLFFEPAVRNYFLAHPGIEPDLTAEQFTEAVFNEEGNEFLSRTDFREIRNAVRILRTRRGRDFRELDIAILFETAREKRLSLVECLQAKRMRTMEEISRYDGFDQIKELQRKRLALLHGQKRNPKLKSMGSHYLFYGNPGTGKTEGAKLYHEGLASLGAIGGDLVIASRKDIIASYVGQTAPKVAELFERAAGGTLFVDEAGFFLQKDSGGFVKEALKEFVRFMEIRRDVCVIFAVYPEEKDEFLQYDPGLMSRFSHIIAFRDYSKEQLRSIAQFMWKEQGYCADPEGLELLEDYLEGQKAKNPRCFGNAREARKVVELSIQEAELRHLDMDIDAEGPEGDIMVLKQDIRKAIDALLGNGEQEADYGFRFDRKEDTSKTFSKVLPLKYEAV